MFDETAPGRPTEEIVDCGTPWHGAVSGGALDYGGASPMTYAQPDSPDAYVVRVPDAPGSAQDPLTVQAGHQWLDYGVLSGWWHRQLYGQDIGSKRVIYSAGIGFTYVVDLSDLSRNIDGTTFGGDIVFSRTHAEEAPEAARTVTLSSVSLGASYMFWDVIAFSEDGSRIMLGFWPQNESGAEDGGWSETIDYSEGNENRGMASVARTGAHAGSYRPPPLHLVELQISGSGAALAVSGANYKTRAQMIVVESAINDQVLGDPIIFNECVWTIDTVVTGPSNQCSYDVMQHLQSFEDGCQDGISGKDCYCYDDVAHYTSSDTTSQSDYNIIVGAYYSGTTIKLIKLRVRYYDNTVDSTSGVGGESWVTYSGTVWNGSSCETASAGTPPSSDPYFHTVFTTTKQCSVTLMVDGVEKSSAVYEESTSGYSDDYVYTPANDTSSFTESASLSVDGVALWSSSANAGTVGYTELNGMSQHAAVNINVDTGTCYVHGIRYSNNAYGLMLTGLSSAFDGDAYIGGVVNVVSGTRETAAGFFDSPNHTVEYAYLNCYVSVQPVTGDLSASGSVICYV